MRRTRHSRFFVGVAVAWALAGAGGWAAAEPDAVFSTRWNQYGDETGRTMLGYRVYHTADGIRDFAPAFVPGTVGLDAVSVSGRSRLSFSVEQRGYVSHAGGMIQLEPDRVYEYETGTGVIRHVVDWSDWGISVGGLDGLDRLWNGKLAFSTETIRMVHDSRRVMHLYPENVYVFNPATGRIRLLFDGRAFGLRDLDALDVLETGRVVFSTSTNVFVTTPRQAGVLRHEDAHVVLDSGNLARVVDGSARGIQSLDAVDADLSMLAVGRRFLHWSERSGFVGSYDVLRGSLGALHADSSLGSSIVECLVAGRTEPVLAAPTAPDPGDGWWFLVRERGGSYDTGGPAQTRSRDPEIQASGADCQ